MEEDELKEKREKIVKGVKNFFSSFKEGDEEERRKVGEGRGEEGSSAGSRREEGSSAGGRGGESGEEEIDLKEKREELVKFVKKKKAWLVYVVLGVIIWFGSYIRTRNLWLLKDVTTGKYIPQALDPFIFLKYANHILEKGSLMAQDLMRFVPSGAATINYAFMSYFIVYLYKIIHIFSPGATLEFVDIIYPVVCFIVGLVFFFLLVRKLFDVRVGLIATLFLAIVPAFLHRTMAGFSDHEAVGTMLMFMAMYFYVLGWQAKKIKSSLGWGLLAGVFTGLMGLSWGGWKFLILIISLFILIEFFFDKVEKKDVYQYLVWIVGFVLVTTVWLPQFTLEILVESFTTGIAFLVMFMLLVDLALFKFDIFKLKKRIEGKVPLSAVSFGVSICLGILVLLAVVGPEVHTQLEEISDSLLHPMGNNRWQLTVAEQHQPYFTDWISYFGPQFLSLPLYLVLFMSGSVIMFYLMVKKMKQSLLLSGVYLCFILAFVLSRYSPSSTFNGVNFTSMLVYLGSLGAFILLAVFFYFRSFYKDKKTYSEILGIDKKYIFVLVWFLILVVGARGAARLIFIFVPITAVLAGFAVVWLGDSIWRVRQKWYRYLGLAVLLLILLSPFAYPMKGMVLYFGEQSLKEGKYSGPGYNQQWQIAGAWARENIPAEAVFGHWWDYGYWVQGGFQRAAVLDGANKITYWNYLMGRHVLCGQNQTEALEFLKVHQATHYLIVSDEIGKYTAYSSIGADEDYDRYSWITTFTLNPQATQETRNETVFVYQGGYMLDDDFVWEGKVYPRMGSGIGGIFLPVQQREEVVGNETMVGLDIHQPSVALIYQGKRVDVPLECVYFNGKMLRFEKPGMKGCFRIIPTLDGQGQLDNMFGAGMYVSEEGVKALWTNLYVFEQNNPDYDTSAFKLKYNGDGYPLSTLALVGGRLMGPIKIWEIEYPAGFKVDEEVEEKYLGGNELLEEWFFEV